MACTCPSGTKQTALQNVGDPYCEMGACTSGNTTYTKTMWQGKQISCQNTSGVVSNYGCDTKAGCCA